MPIRKVALGTVAVFVLWSILDFVIHGVLLSPLYAALPNLFRPMQQILMPLLYGVTLLVALCYTILFGLGGPRTGVKDALAFGLFYGLATGLGMGFGTYAVQPISLGLAFGWFAGTLVETIAGALLLHWLMRPKAG